MLHLWQKNPEKLSWIENKNTKLRKKYLKYPSRENFGNMKKVKKNVHLFAEPFLTKQGCMSNDFISTKKGDSFIDKESELVEMFNTDYMYIVEKTLGASP